MNRDLRIYMGNWSEMVEVDGTTYSGRNYQRIYLTKEQALKWIEALKHLVKLNY